MSSNKANNLKPGLITAKDLEDPFENPFKNDVERIKYMKMHYGHMPLAKSFSVFYGTKISQDTLKSKKVNNPVNIVIGECYRGNVESISKDGVVLTVPGVKEDVISKENFMDCIDYVRNYLLNHNNELLFTVTEKKDNKYIVSILDGYYKAWQKEIERAIEQRASMKVHIDSLVKGGYMCHTSIWTIKELTGKEYTSAVFIPGSNIVLNIETDFERWLDKDVEAIPQKFTKFRSFGKPIENSLLASRKMVLKIMGMKNMFEIWHRAQLGKRPDVKYTPEVFDGKVTGIINSNKKSGVFIELEDKYITGLMPVDSSQLLNYHPGDIIQVYVEEFEVPDGVDPFYIDRHKILRKCNVRPIFARA